jgi:hypothetical protein
MLKLFGGCSQFSAIVSASSAFAPGLLKDAPLDSRCPRASGVVQGDAIVNFHETEKLPQRECSCPKRQLGGVQLNEIESWRAMSRAVK